MQTRFVATNVSFFNNKAWLEHYRAGESKPKMCENPRTNMGQSLPIIFSSAEECDMKIISEKSAGHKDMKPSKCLTRMIILIEGHMRVHLGNEDALLKEVGDTLLLLPGEHLRFTKGNKFVALMFTIVNESGFPKKKPKQIFFSRQAMENDPQLAEGARGARKLTVTDLYDKKEVLARHARWRSPKHGERCEVVQTPNFDFAVFNHHTVQDRHDHERGQEAYLVIGGQMIIEVTGVKHHLAPGEVIIVEPGAVHQVHRDSAFLAQVITVKPNGKDWKRLASK